MKKFLSLLTALILLAGCAAAFAEQDPGPAVDGWTTRITARYATVEEGQQLMRERNLFHNQINDYALDFFLQRKGGTLEEYIEYSAEQVLPFTPEEEQRLNDTLEWLHNLLEKHGLRVPDPGPITFVKTTGREALGSGGYTSGGAIFLRDLVLSPEHYPDEMLHNIVVHELSHCFSRCSPEYRKGLYSLVSFTVTDHEFEMPEEIRSRFFANPDVEHHDSYATFTINGEKKDCYLVFLSDSVFENPGDTFFEGMYSGVIPTDGSGVYRVEDVEDFWDIVGRNTNYVEDPEELMASNVAFALVSLEEGYEKYQSPELLDAIIRFLTR